LLNQKASTGDVLIDTSAWIEAFRGKDRRIKEAVGNLLKEERAVFCGIIELELIQGFRKEDRSRCLPLLDVLPYVEVERQDWRTGGELLAALRSRGITIPATDAVIATLCQRHDLTLLTLDKHFQSIPRLRLFGLPERPARPDPAKDT